jgi:phage terminase large subunit-like protein
MKTRYKIRFHLAKGKNFMKWQIKSADGVEYINPKEFSLHLEGVTLKNRKATAERINSGSNKSVCAWMLVDSYRVTKTYKTSMLGDELRYNPRIAPHWLLNGEDADGMNIDKLTSNNNKLYLNN